MDTFELLPSLAQGELSETSTPELVSAVFRSRASGTLWMEPEEGNEIRCFFRAGDMCGTASFKGFQTLAHVLLANDWVDALDIDSSREEAAANAQRHGEVLIAKGLLTPDQLRTALGAQHTANLKTLLALTTGKYDWRGWEPPPPWAREVTVDPVSCVIDALEQEHFEPRRRKVLDWLGHNAARLSLDWPELQARVDLGPVERRAAALLALPRNLEEFVHASRLPQTRAEALLVALLLAGGVEPQPRSASSAPPPQPRVSQPARAPQPRAPEPEPEPIEPEAVVEPEHLEAELAPEPAHEPLLDPLPEPLGDPEPLGEPEPIDELRPEELHTMPQPPPASSDPFAEAELQPPRAITDELPAIGQRRATVDEDEALKRLDSLSLDDMAPSTPAPPPAEEPLEIDHRPRSASKAGGSTGSMNRDEVTFDHPLETEAPPPPSTDDLRKKLRARGMRNLGTMTPPSELEGAQPVQSQRAAAPIDTSQLSPEDQRFVDEVRSRLRAAPKQDAYGRLGLSSGVTQDQIKAAYLAAAKRFHPDRASSSPTMTPLTGEVQTLFALLKDAFDAIATPELRAKYDAAMKSVPGGIPGAKAGSRKEEAAIAVKMGEVLLKKRDFEGALNKLRRAVDLDATGDALAALAWALVADPKGTPQSKEEAASLINRALRAPGATARTYYVAGVLWRTKDPDSAADAFRKALEMDPNHSDASLELRLLEQRRGKQQKTGGGVLSGLLFGKRKS